MTVICTLASSPGGPLSQLFNVARRKAGGGLGIIGPPALQHAILKTWE